MLLYATDNEPCNNDIDNNSDDQLYKKLGYHNRNHALFTHYLQSQAM